MIADIESHSPDFIPGEVKESYGKWYEGEMKKAKDLKTWAEQNKVSEDVAERVIAAKRDVAFYVKRLSELWRRITTGRGSDIESVKTGGHKSGTGLDVDAFIKQAPSWLSGNYNDLKVMNQREAIVAPSDRPLRIEISLMIDQSISMGEDHKSEKNKLVERVSILLNESIDDFNRFLMSARERSKSELHADTEVIVFGNEAEVVQPFRYTKSGCRGADADRRSATKGVINFNTFKHIGTPRGYTYDNEALTKVEESMTHQELARIKEGKTLKIAFLITDGGSSNPSETFKKIEELTRRGVQVFAFQIGEVNDGEKVTFENTWNKSKDGVKRGYVVGEDFGLLPDLVAKMLEKYLGNVKIYK